MIIKPRKYKAPSKELENLFKEFKKNLEYINNLFGIFYNFEGRAFYNAKLSQVIKNLYNLKKQIDKEYRKKLKLSIDKQKFIAKYKKIQNIRRDKPGIPKQVIAKIVNCSVRHVERVLYGEI